jgi:hypothetical protein
MLTYRLHTRVFQLEPGQSFQFPNRVAVAVQLEPKTAFGASNEPSRTAVRAHKAQMTFNANTGRSLILSDPPLEPLDVTITSPDTLMTLKGHVLNYEFPCESLNDLEGALIGLQWILPPLLNLGFTEPPTVYHISGKVGDTQFRWEHAPGEWRANFWPITANDLEERFIQAVESLSVFSGTDNRRLAAAISYFHTAVRLSVCGYSQWEFMAETILNYAKCLDILFATSEASKDDARKGLKALGYSQDEIEGDFIPILILRSFVDVAHPRVALYKRDDLRTLYSYMSQAEGNFKGLLIRVLELTRAGTKVVPDAKDLKLSGDERKGMDRLMAQMQSRVTHWKESGDAKIVERTIRGNTVQAQP